MSLAGLAFMLKEKLVRLEGEYVAALQTTNSRANLHRHHRLEGLISSVWQAYCQFVRHTCIESAKGCVTTSGITHLPSIVPISTSRASYIAVRTGNRKNIIAGMTNADLWREPTWGDGNKIVDIVNALNPGNALTLKAAFAGGLTGPKHCQIVRNACAHTNTQTLASVRALAPYYNVTPIQFPTDALSWIDVQTGDDAFVSWINDIRIISDAASA